MFLVINWAIVLHFTANAQDTLKENQGIEFSGSADVYYKYDFAGGKTANIPTVFANESNSVSIGMLDLAMKQLAEASREIVSMDEMKKEIVYNLGLIYQRMGEAEKALACMKQIYEVDYGYHDVAQRVESLHDKKIFACAHMRSLLLAHDV